MVKPHLNVRRRLLDRIDGMGKATIDSIGHEDGSWALRVRLFSADDKPTEPLSEFEGYPVVWYVMTPPRITL